jgi:hypothetical protein
VPRITCLHGHAIELLPEQIGQRIACPICQLLMTVSPPRPGEPLVPKYEVLCQNGHVLRVKSKYLGTQIRCPQCQTLATVTTDRLQKHTTTATTEPIVPALFAPMPRETAPSTVSTPIVNARALGNIPVAEVDEDYVKPPKLPVASIDVDDEEDNSEELTKAERRNLKLVDQGLGYYLGSVIGYCSLQMVSIVFSFLLFLLMQAVSTANGFETISTISDVIGWCIFIVMVLNALLYLGGIVLTLFMPWVTGVTIWFVLTLVMSLALLGWILFVSIHQKMWNSHLPLIFSKDVAYSQDKLFYFIGEAIFLFMWLTMTVALWHIAKYARKPLTRQRVMLLGMLGSGCWLVITLAPLLSHLISGSKAVAWILLIFRVILTLGIGGLMIFQHLNAVNEVRRVMYRRR